MIKKFNKKATLSFIGIALFVMLRISLILEIGSMSAFSVTLLVLLSLTLAFLMTRFFLNENEYSLILLGAFLLLDPLIPMSMESSIYLIASVITAVAIVFLFEFKAKMQGLIAMIIYSLLVPLLFVNSVFNVVPMVIAMYIIGAAVENGEKRNRKMIGGALGGISAAVVGIIGSKILHFFFDKNGIQFYLDSNSGSYLYSFNVQKLLPILPVMLISLIFFAYFLTTVYNHNPKPKRTVKSKSKNKTRKLNRPVNMLTVKIIIAALLVLFLLGFLIIRSMDTVYPIGAEPIILISFLYVVGERSTVSLFEKTDEFLSRHVIFAIVLIILYAGMYSNTLSELYEEVSTVMT